MLQILLSGNFSAKSLSPLYLGPTTEIPNEPKLFGLYGDNSACWSKIELGQVAFIQTGVAKGKKANPKTTVDMSYIGVSNVQDGYLDLADIKTITVDRSKVDQVRLQEGDMLMTEGGDPDKLGRGTVWQGEIKNCIHQNHIFAVRPDPLRLNSWFLAALCRSSYGKQYFLSCSKRTSNLATINKTQVGNFLIPCPEIDIQQSIIWEWQKIRNSISQSQERLKCLKQLQVNLMNSVL